jgi:hypothetical protein
VERKQAHLGVGDNTDDLEVLLHAAKVPFQLLLAHVILPFCVVLGEGLLNQFVSVLTEAPFVLITDRLSKDSLEDPEALRDFYRIHNSYKHHRQLLHSGHSLYLLLVTLDPGLLSSHTRGSCQPCSPERM